MPLYSFGGHAPVRHPSAWVAPSADVIGEVVLGEESSVWFCAVIRGDNTPIMVGAETNIQEGAMLHSDPGYPLTVGPGCTVGHHAILHGCTVGAGALVGMGATVLNGAAIGEECLVGAGALVTEGKTFAPGSLIVGSPARAVRALSEEERSRLRLLAVHYARRARAYAEGLTPIE